MKNLLIITFFLIISTQVYGQAKVNGKVPLTLNQEMIKKGAFELKESAKMFQNSIITGGLSIASFGFLPLVSEDNRKGLYFVGGVLAIASIVCTVKVPIHLKRSSMYFEASATGVRVTF
jgi:hypothetical protein